MANPWDNDPIATPGGGGGASLPWANDPIMQKSPSADYESMITQAATKYGVPEKGLRALLQQESGFNPQAVSPKGASGIAQFMPETAKQFGIDPFKPEQAIPAAAQYLKQNYDEFGSWDKALAAYNAGPERVRTGGVLPAETQNYTTKLSPAFAQEQVAQASPAATNGHPWESDPISQPAKPGFFEKNVSTPAQSGFRSFQQQMGAANVDLAHKQLQQFGMVDEEVFRHGFDAGYKLAQGFGDPAVEQYALAKRQQPDPAMQAQMDERRRGLIQKAYSDIEQGAQSTATASEKLAKLPQDETVQKLYQTSSPKEWAKIIWEDPLVIARVGIQNLPQMIPSVITGAAGAPGLGSMTTDTYATMLSALQAKGVDLKNAQAVRQALLDPTFQDEVRRQAQNRALPIGVLDQLTFGLASISLLPKKLIERGLAGKLGELGLQTGVQMAGGAGGEALGQKVMPSSGQPTDILLEALGEVPGGAAEAAGVGLATGKYAKGPDVKAPMSEKEFSTLFQGDVNPPAETPPSTMGGLPTGEAAQPSPITAPVVQPGVETSGVPKVTPQVTPQAEGAIPQVERNAVSQTTTAIAPEIQIAREATRAAITTPSTTIAQRVAMLPPFGEILQQTPGVSGTDEALRYARQAARMRDTAANFTAENQPKAAQTAQAAAEKYMQQAEMKGFSYTPPEEAQRQELAKRGMASVGAMRSAAPSVQQQVQDVTQPYTGGERIFRQNPEFFQHPIETLRNYFAPPGQPGGLKKIHSKLYTAGEHPSLAKAIKFIRPLASRLMPEMRLVIDTREGSPFQIEAGSYTGFTQRAGVIHLHPSTLDNEALLTAAITHEMGHALVHYHWASTPTDQQQAIYAAFGRHLMKVFGPEATAGMFLDDLHSPFALATIKRIYDSQLNHGSMEFLKESFYASWYSFDEWIAEQASKWMFTNARVVTLMDRFFSTIGNAMEKVLKMVGRTLPSFSPEAEVKAWLNSMLERRMQGQVPLTASGTLEQYRAGVEENAKALGMPTVKVPTITFRGNVYYGKPGQTHLQLMEEQGLLDMIANATGAEYSSIAEGWVTPEGKILDESGVGVKAGIAEKTVGLMSVVPPQAETIPFRSLALKLPGIFTKKSLAQSDKWSGWIKWTNNLLQQAALNPHIVGLQSYVESTRAWWITKMQITSQAVGRLREWNKLGKENAENLDRFIFDIDSMSYLPQGQNARWPTTQELAQIAKKHFSNVSAEQGRAAVDLYFKIKQDFLSILDRVEAAWVQDAARSFANDPLKMSQAIAEIHNDVNQMRAKPYFPHERFGKWTVKIRDKGKLIYYTQVATEREATKLETSLRQANPGMDIRGGRLPDEMQVFQGLPPGLIRQLSVQMQQLPGGLSQDQKDAMDDLAFAMSPANSFAKKFMRRKGTAGFSMDARRAYASYFLHAGGHIARLQERANLEDGIKAVYASANAMPNASAAGERVGIADAMKRHMDYIMNPPNEWTALRGVGFFWYLWGNVSSALMNLVQVPMFTLPYLSSRFGDFSSMNALRKSTLDLHKTINLAKSKLPTDETQAIALGVQQEFLDESFATELVSMAQGGVMQRIMPGTQVQRGLMNLLWAGSWLFQKAEQINRRNTFLAAYRLGKEKPNAKHLQELVATNQRQYKEMLGQGWNPQNAAAWLGAREAVERSQFEYAQFARPEFVRGKKGVVFAFWMWKQNALWFFKNDPGRYRAMVTMLALAGVMGLPLAGDLNDLIRYLASLAGKNFNPEQEARQLLAELHVNPDLVLHGAGHDSFGMAWAGQQVGIPIPDVDVSQRLGMGQLIPGLHEFTSPVGSFAERSGNAMKATLGAIYGIPLTMLKAAESHDPHVWHEVQQYLPIAFKNFAKTMDVIEHGGVVTPGGAKIVDFDTTDVHSQAELAAMALGFNPSRVSRAWDEKSAIVEAVAYWQGRRGVLFQQFADARFARDREAIADAREAIKEFNRTVPEAGLKISVQDILQSLRGRQKRNLAVEKNRAGAATYEGVAREVRRGYPNP